MPNIRRYLIELVDVLIPESIEVGKRYIAKVKVKNVATAWPIIYRYNYTVDDEEKVEVEGTTETVIKAGEEAEIEIERVAKKKREHWEVEVFRGITSKNTLTEPQFTEEFDVPKEVPLPPGIEVTGFEIVEPGLKEIYASGIFTGKTTIRNVSEAAIAEVTVKIKQYDGDPASPYRTWDLGEVTFVDVAPGTEVTKEAEFSEKSGTAGEYSVCAVL